MMTQIHSIGYNSAHVHTTTIGHRSDTLDPQGGTNFTITERFEFHTKVCKHKGGFTQAISDRGECLFI